MTASAKDDAQFAKRLRTECQFFAEKYGYSKTDAGRGFEGWLAHLCAQEHGFNDVLEGSEPDEADLGEVILRSHDLGVDVVLEDSDNKIILLIQAKWKGKGKQIEHQEVESFYGLYNRLQDQEFVAAGGTRARELLSDFEDKVNDGYNVILRFSTNKPLLEGDRLWKSLKSTQNAYDKAGYRVNCELFGQEQIKELQKQVQTAMSGILTDVSFSVLDNKALLFDESKKTLICRIRGNELRDLFKRHGQSLFALNIRVGMGLQRAINREISGTAGSDPSNFFYYNNGVSAVCASFEYNDKRNEVIAERFQIINGAQTVQAIAGAAQSDQLSVLFRLTQTEEKSSGHFTENVVRYNNTQNPVEVADFRANDEIQRFLVKRCKRLSGKGPIPHFVYVPKRGTRAPGRGGVTITSKHLAALRHSILYGPVASYRTPKSLFDVSDSGRYWEAFGSGRKQLSDTWTDAEVAEVGLALAMDFRIGQIVKDEKAKTRRRNDDPPSYIRYVKRSSRYVVALMFEGLRGTCEDFEAACLDALSETPKFELLIKFPYRCAVTAVDTEIKKREKEKRQVRPEYNFLRDEAAWIELKGSIVDDIRTAESLG